MNRPKGARARTYLHLFTMILAVLMSVAACMARDDAREECPTEQRATCISGQQVSCPCADGTTSIQTCLRTSFGVCQCPAGIDAGGDATEAETSTDGATGDGDAAQD